MEGLYPAFQFQICLNNTNPVIWRRVLVPNVCNFFAFHRVLQCTMGWQDKCKHQFTILNPITGDEQIVGTPVFNRPILNEQELYLCQVFSTTNRVAEYTYDLLDEWNLRIIFEFELANDGGRYPRCIEGQLASPPEGCGGAIEFGNLMEILKNPRHPEYEARSYFMHKKYPEGFYPSHFIAEKVVFQF